MSIKFAHLTAALSEPVIARLTRRQIAEGLQSLTYAIRLELEERIEAGLDFGPVLAPSRSWERRDLYLPRTLTAKVRELAAQRDTTASNMITTILSAPIEPGQAEPLTPRAAPSEAAPAAVRRGRRRAAQLVQS